MKFPALIICGLTLTLFAASPSFAQGNGVATCTFNDGSGSDIDLRIGGLDPSDFVDNIVPVGLGAVDLDIGGTPGIPYFLLAGNPQCGAIATNAAVDQIDLLNIAVIATGTTSVTYTASIPQGLFPFAVQAVYFDVTTGRWVASDSGRAHALPITVTSYSNWIDDGSVTHTLSQVGADSITFGGTAYTEVHLCSNGPITFTGGTGDFSTSLPELFDGWGAGLPGVAAYWGDFQRSTAMTDETIVIEDGTTGTVTVLYQNQEWWDSQTPAGDFSASFGTNAVTIDVSGVLPGVAGTDQDPIIGVTDGSVAGTDSTLDLSASQGSYASAAGPDSIGEQFAAGTAVDVGVLTFTDPTGTFSWILN